MNKKFKKIAILAAQLAGNTIKYYYGKKLTATSKENIQSNYVTKADLKSEELIIKTILSEFPDHNILSEETGSKIGSSEYTWIIDPLDGTTNFFRNIPIFSVSIALAFKSKVILGLVYNPITEEMFFAQEGTTSTLNNKIIHISNKNKLQSSIVSQSFDYSIAKRKDNFKNIKNIFFKIEGFRLYHSTAIELCYVACGRTEGYIVSGSNPWDIAAGGFILESAGGKVTDFDGGRWSYLIPRIVATNKSIHKELLNAIK